MELNTATLLIISLALLVGGLLGSWVTVFALKQSGGMTIKLQAAKDMKAIIEENQEIKGYNEFLHETVEKLVQELCWCNNCLFCTHFNTDSDNPNGECTKNNECFTGTCNMWKHHILTSIDLDYSLLKEFAEKEEKR